MGPGRAPSQPAPSRAGSHLAEGTLPRRGGRLPASGVRCGRPGPAVGSGSGLPYRGSPASAGCHRALQRTCAPARTAALPPRPLFPSGVRGTIPLPENSESRKVPWSFFSLVASFFFFIFGGGGVHWAGGELFPLLPAPALALSDGSLCLAWLEVPKP